MKPSPTTKYAFVSLTLCFVHFLLMDLILDVGDIYQVDWAEFVLMGSLPGTLPSSWYAPVLSHLLRFLTQTFGVSLKYGLWLHLFLLEVGQFFLMWNACHMMKSFRGLLFGLLPFLFLFTALFYPLSRDGVFTLTLWALIHMFMFHKLRRHNLKFPARIVLYALETILIVFALWTRQNAFLLIVPVLIGALLWETRGQPQRRRLAGAALAVIMVGQGALYQALIRTSDGDMVDPANAFIGQDLMAMSIDEARNLIPPDLIHRGPENQYREVFDHGTEAEKLAIIRELFDYRQSDTFFWGTVRAKPGEPEFTPEWTNRLITRQRLGFQLYWKWAAAVHRHPLSYLKLKAQFGLELILRAKPFWIAEYLDNLNLDGPRTFWGVVTRPWLVRHYLHPLRASDFAHAFPRLGQAFYDAFYGVWIDTPWLKNIFLNFAFYLIGLVYLIIKSALYLKSGKQVFYLLLFFSAAAFFFLTLIPISPSAVWKYLFPVVFVEMGGGIYLFLNRKSVFEL